VSPVPHRLDGRIRRPHHGNHDDRDAGVDSPELPQDLQARLVGQTEVEENDIRGCGPNVLEALATRVGDLDSVLGGEEEVANLLREQVRVIIDQQQVGHARRPLSRCESKFEKPTPSSEPHIRLSAKELYGATIVNFGLPFGIIFAPAVVGAESSLLLPFYRASGKIA